MKFSIKLSAVIAATLAMAVPTGGVASATPAATPHAASVSNYQIVNSGPATVAPNTQAEASATCPAGTVPFSGGESNSAAGNVHLARSDPYQNTWYVDVYNTGATSANFTAYAVCGSGLTNYQVVFGDPVNVDTATVDTHTDCPAGMSILGGGDWISGPLNVQLYQSSYFWDLSTDQPTNSWEVAIANHNTQEIAVEPIAVCGTGLNVQGAVYTANISGQYTELTATCPAGTSILGGGFTSTTSSGTAREGVITDSYPSSNNSWIVWDFPTNEANDPLINFRNEVLCT